MLFAHVHQVSIRSAEHQLQFPFHSTETSLSGPQRMQVKNETVERVSKLRLLRDHQGQISSHSICRVGMISNKTQFRAGSIRREGMNGRNLGVKILGHLASRYQRPATLLPALGPRFFFDAGEEPCPFLEPPETNSTCALLRRSRTAGFSA